MNKPAFATIVGVAIIAIILIGEFGMYANVFSYDAEIDGDGNYSISDNAVHPYSVVLSDNGSFSAPTKIYIFDDDKYGKSVRNGLVEIGAKPLDQKYYISQLTNNLRYYGFTTVETINAEKLQTLISDTAGAKSIGLVMLSGAIPETVYDGTSDSPIVQWIASGGTLYWAGNLLGWKISHSDGTVTEFDGDYQKVFFGRQCLNPQTENLTGRDIMVFDTITDNDYRKALSLKNNNILFGVDATLFSKEECLAVGFTDGKYASIAFVKNGEGQICVLAGDYSNNQRMDLATIIPAGVCYTSEIVSQTYGTVSHGTVDGKVDVPAIHGNLIAFIYLGGDFSVFGKTFIL